MLMLISKRLDMFQVITSYLCLHLKYVSIWGLSFVFVFPSDKKNIVFNIFYAPSYNYQLVFP